MQRVSPAGQRAQVFRCPRAPSRFVERAAIAFEGLIGSDDVAAGRARRNLTRFFTSQANGDLIAFGQAGVSLNGALVDLGRNGLE